MIQKCSILKVLEVFFREPTAIHFIREISKQINLAPTSVKNHINELLQHELVIPKSSKPFNGFIANRDNEKFLYYKKTYNILTLYNLKQRIIESVHPNAIVLFGSYLLGEDIETSDIDILIISKTKKQYSLASLEEQLKRNINLLTINNMNKLGDRIQKKIRNGLTLHGEI